MKERRQNTLGAGRDDVMSSAASGDVITLGALHHSDGIQTRHLSSPKDAIIPFSPRLSETPCRCPSSELVLTIEIYTKPLLTYRELPDRTHRPHIHYTDGLVADALIGIPFPSISPVYAPSPATFASSFSFALTIAAQSTHSATCASDPQ